MLFKADLSHDTRKNHNKKDSLQTNLSAITEKSFLKDLLKQNQSQQNNEINTQANKMVSEERECLHPSDIEIEKEPQTAQLVGNFIIRSLAAGAIGNYIAIKHKDLMAAAANIATSAMWFCEDFGSLVKRGYDIHKGTYKPQKKDLITIEFKDIKTSEDTEKFVDESLKRFGQNVMTKNAFKEMLPFVAFDFIQGELYGAYQDAHPASSYHSTKEFLEQTKKLLISSCLAGLITYPLQDSMDQIPGNIAKFFANRLLKPNAKLKSQQKAVPTYLPSNGVNHG